MRTHGIEQKWKSCQSWGTAVAGYNVVHWIEHQKALVLYVFALRHTLMLSGKRVIFRWSEQKKSFHTSTVKKDGNITCTIMWYMCMKFLNIIATPPKSQSRTFPTFLLCAQILLWTRNRRTQTQVSVFSWHFWALTYQRSSWLLRLVLYHICPFGCSRSQSFWQNHSTVFLFQVFFLSFRLFSDLIRQKLPLWWFVVNRLKKERWQNDDLSGVFRQLLVRVLLGLCNSNSKTRRSHRTTPQFRPFSAYESSTKSKSRQQIRSWAIFGWRSSENLRSVATWRKSPASRVSLISLFASNISKKNLKSHSC